MQAILHGKPKAGPRGTPPKSVAGKYSSPGKSAPEQHGSNSGGTWGEAHHAKDKEKVKHERTERKKKKSKLKKSFESFYKGKGVGAIVLNDQGHILVGRQKDLNQYTLPGGHVEATESYEEAVLRELREEAGIVGSGPTDIGSFKMNGNDNKVFVVDAYRGKVKDTEEVDNWSFVDPHAIPYDNMRGCALTALKFYFDGKLSKSRALKDMLAMESLEKNIIRQKADAVFEVTHGDALKLVGNGAFRWLREQVKDMKDEDFKEVHLDTYTVHIRKHLNDVYSGRVQDGNKVVYQFTNQSLPHLTAALMSVFEWYLPEDEAELSVLDEHNLPDDAIHGGLNELVENYKRHNISNIYQEMENIRGEIRNGAAVDLQQVEARMMKLFDRMEEFVQDLAAKHNSLAREAGDEIDILEGKLREIQSKIDELGKKPETIEAFSANPRNKDHLLDTDYCYLSRPQVEISPDGRIKITFGQDWDSLEKENFLHDMRAKTIKKGK